jgi:hypothetical protein
MKLTFDQKMPSQAPLPENWRNDRRLILGAHAFCQAKRQGRCKLKLSFSGEMLLFCAQPHFKESEFRASYTYSLHT